MVSHETSMLLLICCLILCHIKVGGNYILSKEDDLEIERQFQVLNKPAVKSIKNKYGDIYDCVSFYKQPAFDHPLLKNHTYNYETLPTMSYNEMDVQEFSKTIEMDDETCPSKTVPIRRITKEDLIRERQTLEARKIESPNRPNTFLAVARTSSGSGRFAGTGASLSLHNPRTSGQQFSATRIKLQNGYNSIEAGWRVDPSLYGDTRTRFFIRTDVGQSHCFNTRCPGFVHTFHKISLDHVFNVLSILGGEQQVIEIKIMRDGRTGSWNLLFGKHATIVIGYWPSSIFSGPTGLPDYIEWGGAAYSPPHTHLPQMGSGFPFTQKKPNYNAFICNISVTNNQGRTFDVEYLQFYADDPKRYYVIDLGKQEHHGHVISYGGTGVKELASKVKIGDILF